MVGRVPKRRAKLTYIPKLAWATTADIGGKGKSFAFQEKPLQFSGLGEAVVAVGKPAPGKQASGKQAAAKKK